MDIEHTDILSLHLELAQTTDIETLADKIWLHILRMGCSDYMLFWLPARLKEGGLVKPVITSLPDMQRIYDDERLSQYDVALCHAKYSTAPVYSSHIEKTILTAPFKCEILEGYGGISSLQACFGFSDNYNVISANKYGCVLLRVLSQGVDRTTFRKMTGRKTDELYLLTKVIADICPHKFPVLFDRRSVDKYGSGSALNRRRNK